MVDKELLRRVVYDQRRQSDNFGVERKVDYNQFSSPEISVISGIRRCGKSVLLQQIRSKREERDYYLNFDDDRLLYFTSEDFQTLYDVFVEEFGLQHTFYLDEIQMVSGWERFADRLYSTHNKVFVTGSNAYLLSAELGTLLTGRHLNQQLWPMSFDEYILLKGAEIEKETFYTTLGRARLLGLQTDYLREGGFPQYLTSGNARYLKELYNDILYRDIVVRHKLSSDRQIRELSYYLASNYTHRFTYNSLSKAIGIKSSETVSDYVGYLEEAFLVGIVNKYDHKAGVQLKSPKKAYFVDNALVSQVGFNESLNAGQQLENAVYIEMRRRDWDVYYWQDNEECDFVVREGRHIIAAYQVCLSLYDSLTREREERGLLAAMNAFSLREGYIITKEEFTEKKFPDGRVIHIIPFYRWALSGHFEKSGAGMVGE